MSVARYISNGCWGRVRSKLLRRGDYVVATKYCDGDPGDQFCIGFLSGQAIHYGQFRYMVSDASGRQFRASGFRRVERVGRRRGEWMVRHIEMIEQMKDRYSVWHWYRAPWSELERVAND